MTSKRLAILLILLSVAVSLWGQVSTTYPKAKGLVSDYAGKLDEAQINELSGLIRNYERKTSIEFAVVVVDSLHGRSARDYAVGLGSAWRVGKGGRNNGIVLLWAPNERAYSLRIADGLTADLSDADAKLITQQHLVPYFKRGDYYTGLKETVQTTMAHLGDDAWDQRVIKKARARSAELDQQAAAQRARVVEQQQQAEAQRRRQQAEQAEHDTRVTILFLFVLAALAAAGFAIHRWRQRQRKLAEMAGANQTIADLLATAEANAPQIQRLLDDFSKEAPEQDLTALRAELAAQPDRISKIRADATLPDWTNLQSYDEMVRIKTSAQSESDLKDTLQARIGDIRSAKQQSQALMQQLSQEKFQISDVRDSARRDDVNRLLLESQQQYQQARQSSSMSVFDWLIINDLLTRSNSQVRQAVEYSQEEPYVPPSSSSSSDSESSGSSFGSFFSGGSDSSSSSGGGRGFSGGSGSDGTY
jgi:uncharacterized membrane protein YgcG